MLKISLVYCMFVITIDEIHLSKRLNVFNPNFERNRRTDSARETEENDWLGSFLRKEVQNTGNEY